MIFISFFYHIIYFKVSYKITDTRQQNLYGNRISGQQMKFQHRFHQDFIKHTGSLLLKCKTLLCLSSGFRSVRLSPVAGISTQLLANGRELPVRGPIQITVPLPHSTHWRASNSIPAWAFDRKTGKERDTVCTFSVINTSETRK